MSFDSFNPHYLTNVGKLKSKEKNKKGGTETIEQIGKYWNISLKKKKITCPNSKVKASNIN